MYFKIGTLYLGANQDGSTLSDDDPNPGPLSTNWHKVNIVEVKKIPGRGQEFKTIRTSDKTLWECTLVVRSITDERYQRLKLLCDLGGPFPTLSNHGLYPLYIIDGSVDKTDKDKEKPLKETSGNKESLNVATWTLKLQEAKD
ncbi:MAG: hypothetical protein ACYDHX_17415 [Methanothrix sp.]